MRLVVIFALVCFLLLLSLPLAEIIIAIKHFDAPRCNNDRVMMPANWLLGAGITDLCDILIYTTLLVLQAGKPDGLAWLWRCLMSLFHSIWAIIGAVVLWRDNNTCEPGELDTMLYISVILRLIGAFTGARKKN